jgi:hypothetical protein
VNPFREDGKVESVQGRGVGEVVGVGGESEGEKGGDVEVEEDAVEEFGGKEGEGHGRWVGGWGREGWRGRFRGFKVRSSKVIESLAE